MTDISRRTFLKSTAFTGAAAMVWPYEKGLNKLIPYVIPQDETKPGVWSLFSTTCRECPAGCGMRVRHIDGRTIKAEGNPDHPVNRGSLCARGQSSVQGLYDPDRISQVLHRPRGAVSLPAGWASAIESISSRIRDSGGHVALISNLQTGALAEVMRKFAGAFDSERVLLYEPFNYEALRVAHEKVFGLAAIPDYRLESCDFILSLSADFLESWISPVQFSNAFSESHSYLNGKRGRLCYVGPRLSMTAANADEFLKVPPGTERWIALAMVKIILDHGWNLADPGWIASVVKVLDLKVIASRTNVSESVLENMARAFVDAKASVALAGPVGATGQAAVETAMAAAMLNRVAGRVGQTVDFSHPHALSSVAYSADTERFLSELTAKDVLIVHDANPVYSMTGAAEHIRRAGTVVYIGTMMDETAELADWVLPMDSPLESWGEYEPVTGICSLMQPTMSRLYDTRNAGDILLALAKSAGRSLTLDGNAIPAASFEECLHARWKKKAAEDTAGGTFESFWTDSVRRGFFEEKDASSGVHIELASTGVELSPVSETKPKLADDAFELWVWPSLLLFDGRVANRGWLQEAPDPLSTIVWGSWMDMNQGRAARLGISQGDIVEMKTPGGKIMAPVRFTDDVHEEVAAIAFGQGHTALGRNASGRGANAFLLLGGLENGHMFGAGEIRRVGGNAEPISTCATDDQHHREIVQWVDFGIVAAMKPGDGNQLRLPLPEGYDPKRDLYEPHSYPNHRWAMAVDLDRCTGCGACGVACYAENNLPVIGHEQAGRGRIMAWMRVVPYRQDGDARRAGFIPMFCQQCDAAPCEPVCPVFASVHNEEGLNAQVYNRCIGTRYCSHNCPYKVRRFNWMNIKWESPLDKQLNPDVSVRCRGVMEKCNFCIQRIREVERLAKLEGRPVRDGEIKPACVQTCPTRALIFGDLLDSKSQVSDLTRNDPRRYYVLEELNTKPAVTYLQRVKA